MEFSSSDKVIVDLLLRKKSIDAYQLHLDLQLSTSQIARSIAQLVGAGIIERPSDRMLTLLLAKNALATIFRLRGKLYNRQANWRELPARFRVEKGKFTRISADTGRRENLNFERLGRDLQKKIVVEMEERARKHVG